MQLPDHVINATSLSSSSTNIFTIYNFQFTKLYSKKMRMLRMLLFRMSPTPTTSFSHSWISSPMSSESWPKSSTSTVGVDLAALSDSLQIGGKVETDWVTQFYKKIDVSVHVTVTLCVSPYYMSLHIRHIRHSSRCDTLIRRLNQYPNNLIKSIP